MYLILKKRQLNSRAMFEAIIKDPTILEVTLVLIVLVGIAFWQNLKHIAAILGGIYFMYLIFIMTSYSKDSVTVIVEKKVESKTINIDSVNIVEKEIIEVDTLITKVEDKKEISINDDEVFIQIENQSRSQRNVIDQPIKVLNISFGTRIENRELEGKNRTFTTDTNRIYCLSGIQNRRSDTKLFHKWYHDGELKSKILLNVGKSFNWRTWSYINVYENRVGEWYVVVEDTLGVRHDSLSFTISSSN